MKGEDEQLSNFVNRRWDRPCTTATQGHGKVWEGVALIAQMANMICFTLIYMEECLKGFSNGMDCIKASNNSQSMAERGMVV